MKKLLLSIATVALAGSFAMADTAEFDFANNTYGLTRETDNNGPYIESGTTVTNDGVTLTLQKTDGKNGWRLWSDGLRVYKNSGTAMAIDATGSLITDVEVTFVKTNVAVPSISGTAFTTTDNKTYSWSSQAGVEAPTVTFDVSNNGAIVSISVTYVSGGSGLEPAGLSFPEKSYTAVLGQAFTAPELSKTTDAVAVYTSSNPEVATVDAATGAVTIIAAGETTIKATTPETTTYRAGEASYKLSVLDLYTSIEDFYSAGDGNMGVIDFPLTVAFQSGINTYATDGNDFTLIYGTMPAYEVGDVIPAGWYAQFKQYYNVPEIIPVSEPAESQETVQFTPAEVTSIDASLLNHIVILVGVEFAEDTPADVKTNFTGTVDGTEYAFRTNFDGVASVAAGKYNVRVAVTDFKGAIQLYPIDYKLYDVGVDEITVAEGEAQYYNMQGVRVANPENGMFIRVQNGKAQKVVLK